ncbi:MAG: head GIN domain-containing protein [Weeksellaceae bacterium]
MKSIVRLFFVVLFGFSYAQNKQDVGEFNILEVYDKLTVELIHSNANFIEIRGNKAESVEFINKNKRLKIRMKIDQFLQGDDTKVIVYYTHLNQIYANEGSQVSSNEILSTPSLVLNSKEGARIELEVETNALDIKTNSGGWVVATGKSNSQTVVSIAGGIYDGEGLKTKTTTVTVNAGGEAKVFATDYVNAKTRAGGNIHIFGGAKVDQKTMAGGNIHIH